MAPRAQQTDIVLDIPKWNPETMAIDATCMLVGKRHSGKSVLLRDLLFYLRKRLDLVLGMCPTDLNDTGSLSYFTAKAFRYDSFEDEKLQHLMEWQKRCVANDRAKKIALVLDDCMSERTKGAKGKGKGKKVMQSDDINRVFKMGRHFKLWFANCMQYIKDAPPDVRNNVDLLFAFNTPNEDEREKLRREYFGFFKPDVFKEVFEACTQGHDCIVLDTRALAQGKPAVYHYCATKRDEPFKVGRRVFWDCSDYFFKPDTSQDYEMDPLKVLGPGARHMMATATEEEAPAPAVGKKRKREEPAVKIVLGGKRGRDDDEAGGEAAVPQAVKKAAKKKVGAKLDDETRAWMDKLVGEPFDPLGADALTQQDEAMCKIMN